MPTADALSRTTRAKPTAGPVAGRKPKIEKKTADKPEVRIFVSYSHQDASLQQKLHAHLAPWRRHGVTVWYDKNIESGAVLGPEISRQIRDAHIFVALFSPAVRREHSLCVLNIALASDRNSGTRWR
ncbi:toll/interleukin-1 receptor domain-containing protein [Sphingomonas bacterium]|uniref:toll/interleukin-1 receptor domain-containing protein n=1 Tax=Sphingomonas bacterium TaxID=1895847 RepID=UPI0015776322